MFYIMLQLPSTYNNENNKKTLYGDLKQWQMKIKYGQIYNTLKINTHKKYPIYWQLFILFVFVIWELLVKHMIYKIKCIGHIMMTESQSLKYNLIHDQVQTQLDDVLMSCKVK